ncbi:hypothetical protein EAE99_001391 [Botrytis elliptica]|nr:hypothetical protein EAE99_001391 [Botrytis elliptica]
MAPLTSQNNKNSDDVFANSVVGFGKANTKILKANLQEEITAIGEIEVREQLSPSYKTKFKADRLREENGQLQADLDKLRGEHTDLQRRYKEKAQSTEKFIRSYHAFHHALCNVADFAREAITSAPWSLKSQADWVKALMSKTLKQTELKEKASARYKLLMDAHTKIITTKKLPPQVLELISGAKFLPWGVHQNYPSEGYPVDNVGLRLLDKQPDSRPFKFIDEPESDQAPAVDTDKEIIAISSDEPQSSDPSSSDEEDHHTDIAPQNPRRRLDFNQAIPVSLQVSKRSHTRVTEPTATSLPAGTGQRLERHRNRFFPRDSESPNSSENRAAVRKADESARHIALSEPQVSQDTQRAL